MCDFTKVPVESDTKILEEKEVEINGYKALFQKWIWDGILAESLIFCNEDVKNLSEEDIISMVRNSGFIKDSKTTFTRGEEFTFVNFNFETF